MCNGREVKEMMRERETEREREIERERGHLVLEGYIKKHVGIFQ